MVDSLMAATANVSIVVDKIMPDPIPGLNRDWFDVMKQLASRPSGADKVTLILGKVPNVGSDASDTLAYHRVAELKSLGVNVLSCDRVGRETATLSIFNSDGTLNTVWKWPWNCPLGPEVDGVCRNRLGREQEAAETIDTNPTTSSLTLPILREFNEFTLEPGKRHNFFASQLLGNLLKHFIAGAVIIDPHTLHDPRKIAILEEFLRVLKVTEDAEVIVKAGRIRGEERKGNFTSWSEQDAAAKSITAKFATHRLKVIFPSDGYFVDHDRVIYLSTKKPDGNHYYKVILGQGLFGFHPACNKRSHGVWFEISEVEWTAAKAR
jgi:hypothetical protein